MYIRGSVTVYFVLIFSVLCILITSVIALVRFQAEKTNARLSLNIAEESAFSKYYRPLLDNYGLFYYISDDEESLAADIMSYIVKNQEGISQMLSLTPGGLDVYETWYAMDNNGDNVGRQMKNVIKDTLAEGTINKLISEYRNLDSGDKNNSDKINSYEKEINQTEKEAEKEKDMLKLLELVEGIRVSGGKIHCNKEYVKSGVTGNVTAANAGIDSKEVWEKVKNNSWDMTEYLTELKEKCENAGKGKRAVYSEIKAERYKKRLEKILELTGKAKRTAESVKGIKKSICNLEEIFGKLSANEGILEELISLCNTAVPGNTSEWTQLQAKTDRCIDLLKGYHVKDIVFDYTSINLKKTANPADNTSGNINDMLTYLIGDSKKLSEKTVAESALYENLKTEKKDMTSDKKKNDDFLDFNNTDSVNDVLGKCKGEEKEDTGNVKKKLYVNIYTDRFFREYKTADNKLDQNDSNKHDDEDRQKRKMNNALDYEKEYIINADCSDRNNLKAVVSRILFLRTGTSLIYLMADNDSREMAYATAACLVGFTGLDALVRCIQYLILTIWSYQDACVDTGAVLAGKSIPVIKSKDNLNIRYEELILFGKELLKEKINSYKKQKGLKYSDYIRLFIMAMPEEKIRYRCMDIMQFNMKKNYDSRFSFQRAVYGARTRFICEKPFYHVTEGEYSYR